jgi:tetratricopeptide (TPR) repeat protein
LVRLLFLWTIVLGVFSAAAFSAEPEIAPAEAQAKAVMSNVYDSYVKIIPYAYSTKNIFGEFKNKKEKAELLKNLTDLSQFFKSAKHAELFQRPGFRPSLEAITNHLDETIMSVESDSFIFAQKRLNVIGALCVTCHSQLPESVSKNAFRDNIKEKRERFDSDFAYANYLYLVRRFDDSKKYFEKAINTALGTSTRSANQEVLASLRKIVSIDTKIKFNYEGARASIEKWEKDSRLSINDRKILKRWIDSLKLWKGFDPSSIKSMPSFIEKNLSPLDMKKEIIFTGEEDVTLLISSGVLFNFLVENPDSALAPEILYWLSLAEHRMGQSYFFSLGDLYLKDCIRKYPSSPYAKKCYQEYADSIEAGYSGSSGTDIPAGEKRELNKLKSLLKP